MSDNTDPPKRGPGRLRNSLSPKIRQADLAIAKTLYTLRNWGFSVRSAGGTKGAAELIGLVARGVLGRADSKGQPLGPDRVEQIFEAWRDDPEGFAQEPGGWRSNGVRLNVMPWEGKTTRTRNPGAGLGLVDNRPHWYPRGYSEGKATDEELIAELLRNGGWWPHAHPHLWGDYALTPKQQARWEAAPKGAGCTSEADDCTEQDDSGKTG
jgi:hypothetical protein